MFIDFLDRSTVLPAALAMLALGCMLGGYVVLRDARLGSWAAWTLTAFAALPVPILTLSPARRWPTEEFCTVQFYVPSADSFESLANVALLFPLVFFATIATRRPFLMLLAGAAISFGIEALQAYFPEYGRSCDTNDWVMNTSGAVAAAVLAAVTIGVANRTGASR